MGASTRHPAGPARWARAVLAHREDLGALRASLSALPPQPGFGAFALRDRASAPGGRHATVYLSPGAAPAGPTLFGAWGPWEESGPPADDERLVLLGGDASLWAGVVSSPAVL